MIHQDENFYPLSDDLSGADSTVRAGILLMCSHPLGEKIPFQTYELTPGIFVRHPIQVPCNNPKNFTRDQMKPFIAGLHRLGQYDMIRRFFWKRLRAGFVMQNTERDVAGSTKHFSPHYFYKDSSPTAASRPMRFNWSTFRFEIPPMGLAEAAYTFESRIVDGPDILAPNDIGFLILAGRMYFLYPFLLLAVPFHLLALLLNRYQLREQNQTMAEAYVYGTQVLYKKLQPHWHVLNFNYWNDRGEGEYSYILFDFMSGYK